MTDNDGDEGQQGRADSLFRKLLTVGVGTIFLTEESLRTLVSEVKLPKELLRGVLDSAGKTKREFLEDFSREIVDRVMSRMDPKELIDEVLSRNEIHLEVKVSFAPKAHAAKAESGKSKGEPRAGRASSGEGTSGASGTSGTSGEGATIGEKEAARRARKHPSE